MNIADHRAMTEVQSAFDAELTQHDHRFEPLLDSAEAAALLGIHPKTLQRMARNGTVPAHRIGDLWRFRASELDSWLRTDVNYPSPLVP